MYSYRLARVLGEYAGRVKKARWTLYYTSFLLLMIPSAVRAEDSEQLSIKYFGFKQGRLAFSYFPQRGSKESDIYVVDFHELSIKPLVTGTNVDEYPSWSPDGQQLVYYSDADGDREIYIINADGSGKKRLTFSIGADEDPDWSPDGKKILFHSQRERMGSALYVMNPDGSGQSKLEVKKKKESSINSVPKWSPRGTEVIYSSNGSWPGWDIILFNLFEKKTQLLTTGYQSFCRGSWHPSGGSFVFSYGSADAIDLWQYEKGAASLQPVIARAGRDYDGIFNDDGSRIFFAGEQTPGEGDFQLLVWDAKSTEVAQLISIPDASAVRYLSWTPLPAIKHPATKVSTGTAAAAEKSK